MVRPAPHQGRIAIALVIVGVVAGVGAPLLEAQELIFGDGFESGDISAWNNPPPVLPTVRMAESLIPVNESVGTVGITVSVLDPNDQEIRVDWVAEGGTATGGSDFDPVGGTLIIAAGSGSGSIELQIFDDLLVEADETFILKLSNPHNASIAQPSSCEVTIVDSDESLVVSFAAERVEVAERAGSLELEITLSSVATVDVTVDYATMGFGATTDVDFTAVDGTLTVFAGETSGLITVPILDDELYELDEEFIVALSDPLNAGFGLFTSALVKIIDDDEPPQVSLAEEALTVAESTGTLATSVVLSGPSGRDVTVDHSSSEGTAVAGEDFQSPVGTLTIPAGSISAAVSVAIVDDPIFEAEEIFTITLSDPKGATLVAPSAMIVTITDDDIAPAMTLPTAVLTIDEAVGPVEIIVTLSRVSGLDVTVDYASTNATAIADQDFTAVSGSLLIPAGETSGVVTVPVLDDLSDEPLEQFSVAFSNIQGASLAESSIVELEITDNDNPPEMYWSDGVVAASEFDGVVELTAILSAYSGFGVSVDWITADDTATAGSDYVASSGTLVIPAGATSGTVAVTLSNDSSNELDENFTVTLSGPENAQLLGSPVCTVVISDDEPEPHITISASSPFVGEGLGTVELTVSLSAISSGEVSVAYATVDGTATAGADYQPLFGTLVFAAGEISANLVVTVLDDLLDEDDEVFSVGLSAAAGAALGVPDSVSVTLLDNDPMPNLVLEGSGAIVTEGVGSVGFTARLSTASGRVVTFDYLTVDGAAIAGEDFAAAVGTVSLTPGQTETTISVPIFDDSIGEYDEDFDLSVPTVEGAILESPWETTFTIIDDDQPEVTRVIYSVGNLFNVIWQPAMVTIVDGTAVLDWEEAEQIYPGQRMTYGDDDRVVFVRSCESLFVCEVMTPTGGVPPDVADAEVTEVRHEFDTLAAALNGASDAEHLATTDLAGVRVALEIEIHNSGVIDTTPVVIDGWITGLETPIIIRSPVEEGRHHGRWTSGATGLVVSGGPCIRATVGNLVLEGLQFHCSADPETDLAGILLDGEGVVGRVEVSDVIIRLDGAGGGGERLGVAAPTVGSLNLEIRNTIFYDLGAGTARHAGLLVEDDSVAASVANVTVVGGEYGLRRTAGSLKVVNVLVDGSASACFGGDFAEGSQHNLSSDGSAPGRGSVFGAPGWLLGPLDGQDADHHLACNPLSRSEVSHSNFDIGTVDRLFDGNTITPVRTAAENPAFVELDMGAPVVLKAVNLALAYAMSHRWTVAVADSVSDMSTRSGSYRVVVPWRTVDATILPDPRFVWDEALLEISESARVIRLEVEKTSGDDYVHLTEWELVFDDSPCEGGVDLSIDPDTAFNTDIDNQWRAGQWDIGADEASLVSILSGWSFPEVWETEGEAVFEVLLSEPLQSEVRFGYTVVPLNTTAGVDYTGDTGEIVFEAGRMRQEISIPVFDDGAPDDFEDFAVEISTPGDDGIHLTTMSVTLRDGSPPVRVFLDRQHVVVDELVGSATFEVRLSRASTSDITVDWRTVDGGARMGRDYGGVSADVTIPAGQLAATIEVPILDDELVEADEVFLVEITHVASGVARLGTPTVCEVVIADNEPPAIGFGDASFRALENSGYVEIPVRLNKPVDHEVRVDFAATAGTAQGGEDFEPLVGTLTLPAGETEGVFSISLLDDPVEEGDESIVLTLSNPSLVALGTNDTATLTIVDDDGVPLVVFASTFFQVDEGIGMALVELVVLGNNVRDIDVSVTAQDGSAILGEDFASPPASITIPAGHIGGVVPVPIIADGVSEIDETLILTLSEPVQAALGEPSTVTVNIIGDIVQPRFGLVPIALSIDENLGPVSLHLDLDTPQAGAVGVRVTTVDGEALAGADFIAVDEIVTFDSGQTSLPITIQLVDDAVYEGAESFRVVLSEPAGGPGLSSAWEAIVTIHPSDNPPFVYLADGGSSTAHYTGFETVGEIVIPVRLSDASEVVAQVDFATTPETAMVGEDYLDTSGTLVFAPGVTEREIVVPIIADGVDDTGDTFSIILSNAQACVFDDGPLPQSGVVHLVDGQPEVSFVKSTHIVTEGEFVQFELVLSEPSSLAVEVGYQTFPGTAYSSSDFHAKAGVVQFPPGETRAWTPSILVRADELVEGDEFFSIELSNPLFAVIGAPAATQVTIADRETFQAFALEAVHIEHDLVHLRWRQTPYFTGDSAKAAGWELSRRDADAGGSWQVIAAKTNFGLPTMWRDYLVPGGVRSEYRVIPVYQPSSGDSVLGEADEWSMREPLSPPVGEADNTVVPGFAVVAAGDELSTSANAFSGRHDYAFTLRPDPGPEFSGATVDVYVDDVLAPVEEAEVPQPWDPPHAGLGRDDPATIGQTGSRLVSAANCDGPTCEVVVPGLATGTHTLRFVVTDSGGTSVRSIVQDLHPWWGVVEGVVADYPVPILFLFSDRVPTPTPVFRMGGPVMPFPWDSADHSDVVERAAAAITVNGFNRGAGSFGSDGLAAWSPVTPWVNGEAYELGAVAPDSNGRNLGRDILKRGPSGEHWGGRQSLQSSSASPGDFVVTVDTGLEADQPPTIAWVTPAVVSENNTAELWTDIWLRVEDHDQDVDPHSLTVSNLSLEGGSLTFKAYYADPSEQSRIEGDFGWFVCRMPLSVSGTELVNQLLIHVEDAAGHVVDEGGFAVRRHLVVPGEYPVPVISQPFVGRYYGNGETITMDATSSVIPEGYQVWLGAMVRDGTDAMPLAAVASGASGEFVASWDYDEYVVRLVIATPEAMPDAAQLQGIQPPCRLGDPNLECASADVVVSKAAHPRHVPFELDHVVPDQVMLRFGFEQPRVERSADGGATWQTVSSYDYWWQEYYLIDRDIEEGATYCYRIPLVNGDFYLGQTTTGPGLAVEVPVWAAPRVVPEPLEVTWLCPPDASRYVCQGTLDLRLGPEPGRSLAGTTVRVFLNEKTRQLRDGKGNDLHIKWPENLGHFSGRDVPACVDRKMVPDLVIEVPAGSDSVDITLPGVLFGTNGLRFEVESPGGGYSERAVLVALHDDPVYAEYRSGYAPFLPVLVGNVITSTDFDLWGLGPASRNSPDCNDGDQTYYYSRPPYNVDAAYINRVEVNGEEVSLFGTDPNGLWNVVLDLPPGDHEFRNYAADPSSFGYGNIGRTILDVEGETLTEDLGVYVFSKWGNSISTLTVDPSITEVSPELAFVPQEVRIALPDLVATGTVRFRITDADQDLPIDGVTVTNNSLDPPITVHAFYARQQIDSAGDWGWFVADVPMVAVLGEAASDNQLQFQATDHAGNRLDEVVTVTREGPLVWAEIAEPDPAEAEPNQLITFDGTNSVVPGLDDLGAGVARWFFFFKVDGEWRPYRDPGFADGTIGLTQSVPMPRDYDLKARLIVTASLLDFPASPWEETLSCGWDEGDGRCDYDEVTVKLANPGCGVAYSPLSVIVDSPAQDMSGESGDVLHFAAHADTALSPIAYRWVFYDAEDTNLHWPIGNTSSPFLLWSPLNAEIWTTAEDLGLAEGDYIAQVEARYPEDGCDHSIWQWQFGRSLPISVRINHAFGGLSPGEIVEGAGFRVYSSTWVEGQTGFVFIDDVVGDETPSSVYSGIVESGGFIRVLPDVFGLYAKESPWFVSLATDSKGVGRSIWWGGLQVVSSGSKEGPVLITNEEDVSCGGVGTECNHPILPGQTLRGNWHEPGDLDYYGFIAGAGTVIRITLERVDGGQSAQHPDAPIPEILLARPDGIVSTVSEPLGLDDKGTRLEKTLTQDGYQLIIVRTSKGSGDYLLSLEKLDEGGNGELTFGWSDAQIHITTVQRPSAHLSVPLVDGFGNPLSGSVVAWEQGEDCGVGEFCAVGRTVDERSGINGLAYLNHEPIPGDPSLWRPHKPVGSGLKSKSTRPTMAKRIADARDDEVYFGRIQAFVGAVSPTVLPDSTTAKSMVEKAREIAVQNNTKKMKNDEQWCAHGLTCAEGSAPVFRAVQLSLDEGDVLVDVELRILDGDGPTERLDGQEVMTDVSLTLEAEAVVRNRNGAERNIPISQPVGLTVAGDRGGAIQLGGTVCESLEVPAGPFTYRVGSDAGVHYVYDEPDGSSCCWIPTEYLAAKAVVDAEVVDGDGETTYMSVAVTAVVESVPRPADPCEVRFYPSDHPIVNTNRRFADDDRGDYESLGNAYLVDACGNVVYGVGQGDSDFHTQPGDEFRIVSPLEPQGDGDGVWAISRPTNSDWAFPLTLRGRSEFGNVKIPDGTYTIDFEVASQSQCSAGGSISGMLTAEAYGFLPQLTFHWDFDYDFDDEVSLRGVVDPKYSVITPGSTIRDASDSIAVWRVPAYDEPDPGERFDGPYTSVPVKIYVASMDIIPFDWDGNVRDTHLEPVEGVVLCTGIVEEQTRNDGIVEYYYGPVRSTCDQTWTTIAEGFASSDPELTGYSPHVWVTMGLGVGIVKAPDQPGRYALVVEPMDESFRRGDSWRIDSRVEPNDNFMKFDVTGGVYLDDEYERFGPTIDVSEPREIYLQAELESAVPTLEVDVEYTDPDGDSTETLSLTMTWMGEKGDGISLYLSEAIELAPEEQGKSVKNVAMFIVKVGGWLASKFQGNTIAKAKIDNGGPVDLDIDSDNNNGSGLPDRSGREEDLETGGGYGKFVFVNHDDDDEDGIPDYADLETVGEDNFVPLVLKIDLPDVLWSDMSVTFEFDGLHEFFKTDYPEIEDPREDHSSPTGFRDFRNARRTGDKDSGWEYPQMRLWAIDDPSQYRRVDHLLFPGVAYSAAELGFGQGENSKEVVLYVEGINQAGGRPLAPQPSTIRVDVQAGEGGFSDLVRLTLVEANLGVNNSNHEPFKDEFTEYGTLRPGVPDIEFVIDQYDEIVEDQKHGFGFWKRAEEFNSRQLNYRPIDMFPIVLDIPDALLTAGFSVKLRVTDENESFIILENPSSINDLTRYLKNELLFERVIADLKRHPKLLSKWELPDELYGFRSSFLVLPLSYGNLSDESVLKMDLVAVDSHNNETIIDSVRMTFQPMSWIDDRANNGVFWMGSARGQPSGSYLYTADTVNGARVIQNIQIYPEFVWYSGPDPDQNKEHYVAYIHGFNTDNERAVTTSSEVYKRLWWSGYRGNFFALTWHGDEAHLLGDVCDTSFSDLIQLLCVSQYFANMENAMQTSPRLKQFLSETVLGDWGADPQKVNLMVHSLGNLVALDALRLHAVDGDQQLIQHLVSVEAAVWEESLWDQRPATYSADLIFSEEDLMRGSWAFWFSQDAHPASKSFGGMFNSYAPFDFVLTLMSYNDAIPELGPRCPVDTGDGRTISRPCPRKARREGRGSGQHFRVPVADGFSVGDAENRPDLGYEIPAMLNPDYPDGHLFFPLRDVSKPLGMVKIKDGENSDEKIRDIDSSIYGWEPDEHSFFLDGPFAEIWRWYDNLTRKTAGQPAGIIPAGKE